MFGDEPGPSTPALLDVLAAAGECATFFLLGANLEHHRGIAERMVRDGHTLGNHTYSHARELEAGSLIDELARTDALIRAVTGGGLPPVRLPYGVVAGDARPAVLARLGRPHIGWTADFGDWQPCDPADLAARIATHVALRHARGEDAVIDLHDASRLGAARPWTVEAVRLLLQSRAR
jgi:peptidoglycan-N-acetylglucosamine deacetylase